MKSHKLLGNSFWTRYVKKECSVREDVFLLEAAIGTVVIWGKITTNRNVGIGYCMLTIKWSFDKRYETVSWCASHTYWTIGEPEPPVLSEIGPEYFAISSSRPLFSCIFCQTELLSFGDWRLAFVFRTADLPYIGANLSPCTEGAQLIEKLLIYATASEGLEVRWDSRIFNSCFVHHYIGHEYSYLIHYLRPIMHVLAW